jgi:hypothetical protein
MVMARDLSARVSSAVGPDPCLQDRRLDSEHLPSTAYRSRNPNKLYRVNTVH